MSKSDIETINAILPQTQCGLCGYKGCKPYAEALSKGEATIDLCPPGGIDVLHRLGSLLGEDPSPHEASVQEQYKPPHVLQVREEDCVGCTKCIKVCPTDAIIGCARHMHVILPDRCTGCDLCVPVCPTDCIEPVWLDEPTSEDKNNKSRAWKVMFEAREERLSNNKKTDVQMKKQATASHVGARSDVLSERKKRVLQAVLRQRSQTDDVT